MAPLRVDSFAISLDGFAAGPGQRAEQPLGQGDAQLHEWFFQTAAMRALLGDEDGDGGLNDELLRVRAEHVGTTIMGRNMSGSTCGPWPDESWRRWWGEDPPFGHDVIVHTHRLRPDLIVGNATVFHFVDAGWAEVLAPAAGAAGERNVVLGRGPATSRLLLTAGLVDELCPRHRADPVGDGRVGARRRAAEGSGLHLLALRCGTAVTDGLLVRTAAPV